MKSCRNCKNYKLSECYCKSFNMNIIDVLSATVCKNYTDKSKSANTKIQCSNCYNINKYNYCSYKKICLSDNEKHRDRSCRNFKSRKMKPKRKYK